MDKMDPKKDLKTDVKADPKLDPKTDKKRKTGPKNYIKVPLLLNPNAIEPGPSEKF
jgi:hypothetical protein